MVRVGVIGASGYGGLELLRILAQHDEVQVEYVAGNHESQEELSEEYPFLGFYSGLKIQKYDLEACSNACDLVFVALPSGASGVIAADLWRAGKRVIDLSGDLRLPGPMYASWYEKEPVQKEVIDAAVYGLSEWHEQEIAAASLIANPGCFATATLLALLPAVRNGLLRNEETIVVDAKTGVSGAGKAVAPARQLAELADNFYPYRVGRHQHTPEIEQELSPGCASKVLLTTQLLPLVRGIAASCYIPLKDGVSFDDAYSIYCNRYSQTPFVRVLGKGVVPQLKHVRGSNETHISVHVDERTRTLQVFSVLDNLQKGAAGQAVQNLNLMNGWPQTLGLRTPALYP